MTPTGIETIITGPPQIPTEALHAAARAVGERGLDLPTQPLEGVVTAAAPHLLATELENLADLLTGIARIGADQAEAYDHGHADGLGEAAVLLRFRARRLNRGCTRRADLARLNAALHTHGAITRTHDGIEHVTVVEPTVLPEPVACSYRFLRQRRRHPRLPPITERSCATMSKRAKRHTPPEFTPSPSPRYVRHAQALRRSGAAGPHTEQLRGRSNRSTIDRAAITASKEPAA
jgi:hypothetical protein